MTMANTAVTSPLRAGASLRKTNKPLMEKRRRARINDSLTQLKSLVIQSSKKDSSQFNKLEKADILELTVKHLRHLQDQQMAQGSNNASLAGKYQAGFMECANEVIRYLGQSQGFTDEVKSRVVHHLASCIQLSKKISIAKSTSITVPTSSSILPAGLHVTNGQYSNGQVIQIVNNHLQKLKSSNITSYPGIQPSSASSVTPTSTVPTHTSIATTSITTCPTPSSDPSSYIKYTQPLQIQIPPVLSPILIQSKPSQHQNPTQPQLIHKPQDTISQLNPHSTNPKETLFSNSPPHSQQPQPISSLPFRTCQKPSKYYSFEDQYSEYATRSRTYSLTSSSSSSESELSSPLNLSQSPKYYDHREANLKIQSPGNGHYIQTSHQSDPSNHPASRDALLLSQCLSSNYASVIVDGRKTAEGHALSCLHFMDEDRHYVRHEGSASPASSVGEDRLWRPW